MVGNMPKQGCIKLANLHLVQSLKLLFFSSDYLDIQFNNFSIKNRLKYFYGFSIIGGFGKLHFNNGNKNSKFLEDSQNFIKNCIWIFNWKLIFYFVFYIRFGIEKYFSIEIYYR